MATKPITLPGIEEYAARHTSPDDEFLRQVAINTQLNFKYPQMMLGPVAGRFLQMLIYASRPNLILEIGTFTGYSALTMAAAMPLHSRIITCERNPEHAAAARRNIKASRYGDRISVEFGRASDIIAQLQGPFDFVLIDADKTNYLTYIEAVLPKLGPCGLIVADNTLWNGNVADVP